MSSNVNCFKSRVYAVLTAEGDFGSGKRMEKGYFGLSGCRKSMELLKIVIFSLFQMASTLKLPL